MRELALFLILVTVGAAAGERIASLATHTLSDRALVIPADLPPGPVVLIVGFTKDSRKQTSAWSRQLANLTPEPMFQVAILEDVPELLRRFVVSGIKSDVPQKLHDRFLIVTQGTASWKALCPIQQEDAACVLLLGPSRDVVWRAVGAATEQAISPLRKLIATLRGQ